MYDFIYVSVGWYLVDVVDMMDEYLVWIEKLV